MPVSGCSHYFLRKLPRQRLLGFTLAELLIALAVLGVIATFTIPKVLTSTSSTMDHTKMKEAYAAINQAFYSGVNAGQINTATGTGFNTYLSSVLNAVKVCNSNSETEGCWNASLQGHYAGNTDHQGFILHSGVTLCGNGGLGAGPAIWNGGIIDFNGTTGPNTQGVDQLFVIYCYAGDCSSIIDGTGPHVGPIIGPRAYYNSLALYESLF